MDNEHSIKIEKEIVIDASPEIVYNSIAIPENITKWFPTGIEGGLNVGNRPILDFGDHGKNQIYVESAKPHSYFAYRWIPGSQHFIGDVLTEPNTLVEFFIEPSDYGSKVTLRETGFELLPPDVRQQKLSDNNGGWDYMLSRLDKLLADK